MRTMKPRIPRPYFGKLHFKLLKIQVFEVWFDKINIYLVPKIFLVESKMEGRQAGDGIWGVHLKDPVVA